MDKQKYISELDFCLQHREKNGRCNFGGGTKCDQCAAPYLLHKLISGEVLDQQKLTLDDWKEKYKK